MNKEIKTNIVTAIAAIFVMFVVWIGLDAFFNLVGGLYTFLDQYIWAFFAGIITFFASLTIVGLMFQITVICIYLILIVIGGILSLFISKH